MERMNQPKDIYNKEISKGYYEIVGDNVQGDKYKTEIEQYFRSLIPQDMSGKKVLDHGCGNARFGELFCQKGASLVVGVDLSSDMIEMAKKRKAENNLEALKLMQGDFHDLPIKDGEFDLVFSRFSLVHSPRIGEVMKQIGDCLKENGEVLLETNFAVIKDKKEEIQRETVPLIMQMGDAKISLADYAITIDEYMSAFKEAGLEIQTEKESPCSHVAVREDYKYKDLVEFRTLVAKLIKKTRLDK
jgi:ubiquinone/menaquinone biosynthesis C-methylase UbiE